MRFKRVRTFPDTLIEELDSNNVELTTEQSNYFKNSKVRNNKNNLLVCYHGSDKEKIIDTLDVNKSSYQQKMIYFTDSKKLATSFSERNGRTGQLFECYINLENPLILDAQGSAFNEISFNGISSDLSEIALYACANGYDGVIVKNVAEYHDKLIVTDIIAFKNNQSKLTSNKFPSTSDRMDS